ncbi:MAG: P-loop NTPase [Bilifractor sp.]|jgi:Mrp family chromosome partitioning ATPase
MAENQQEDFRAEMNAYSNIEHVIGVVSGKGGVGKSMVAASLANAMAAQGYRVGILDADITGPSIPKMYGLHERAKGDDNGIYPPVTENGIEIMSINLLLEGEEEPVVWRGPVLGGVVKQFWTDVIWGQLDYLIIDMPPGTGDVPLTVYQSLPIEGVVIVTSPQDLVKMIVTKAYKMAGLMNIPVLGLIENYSYLVCPGCGRKIDVFGQSHVDEIAASLNIPVLGKIPINEEYARAADEGSFGEVANTCIDGAIEALRSLDQ